MKKLATLVFSFLLLGTTTQAAIAASAEDDYGNYDGNAYIFTEGGVEFSVFPDGQFDFAYVGPNQGGQVQVNVNTPHVNLSFNSGHDYEMYVQYDDYGAVLQIEDVPVYYDNYGRISQAGSVDIQYNDRRIVRVGGLHINYNHYGHYVGYTGYINVYNRFYVARPWHVFYVRPVFTSCVVYDYPYRNYYSPVRYSYGHHRQYYKRGHHTNYNGRRDFYRPGSRNHYKDGRTAVNRSYNPNRRGTIVSQNGRNRSNTTTRGYSSNDVKNNTTRTARSVDKGRTSRTSKVDRSNTSRNNRSTRINNPRKTTTKRATTTTRSTTKGNNNTRTINTRTATTSRSKNINKNDKNSNVKRSPQQRNTVARNSGNKSQQRSQVSRSSTNKTVAQRNSGSRTSKSSNARSNSSKRGKGL